MRIPLYPAVEQAVKGTDLVTAFLGAAFIGSVEWIVGRIYSVFGRESAKEEALAPAGR